VEKEKTNLFAATQQWGSKCYSGYKGLSIVSDLTMGLYRSDMG